MLFSYVVPLQLQLHAAAEKLLLIGMQHDAARHRHCHCRNLTTLLSSMDTAAGQRVALLLSDVTLLLAGINLLLVTE